MSPLSTQGVLPYIHRICLKGYAGDLSDAELLERYILQRDERAFEILLHRFGSMVYGVCRRALGCAHDAEDAFQATFLVFMKKADTIKPRSNVGNWLYGVAYRIALKARSLSLKRMNKEKAAVKSEQMSDECNDLTEVVDHVLSKLPDKYRQVVVLCDLQGKTRKQAARELGCPEGTVAGRLARGRSIMAHRLRRQGISCSISIIVSALTTVRANASMPSRIIYNIVQPAFDPTLGQGQSAINSSRILALTKGVTGMRKIGLFAVVLLAGIALLGVGSLSGRHYFDNQTSAQTVGSKQSALPPSNERKERSPKATPKRFQIDVLITTKKRDGKPITVAMPTIRMMEGKEARLLSGGQKTVPGAEAIESIPFGIRFKAKVFRRTADGKLYVDITASVVEVAPNTQDDTLLRTYSIRAVRPFRDAKQFKLDLDSPADESTRYEWDVTITRLRKEWPSLTH